MIEYDVSSAVRVTVKNQNFLTLAEATAFVVALPANAKNAKIHELASCNVFAVTWTENPAHLTMEAK